MSTHVHSRPHSLEREASGSMGVHSRPQPSRAVGSQIGSQRGRLPAICSGRRKLPLRPTRGAERLAGGCRLPFLVRSTQPILARQARHRCLLFRSMRVKPSGRHPGIGKSRLAAAMRSTWAGTLGPVAIELESPTFGSDPVDSGDLQQAGTSYDRSRRLRQPSRRHGWDCRVNRGRPTRGGSPG